MEKRKVAAFDFDGTLTEKDTFLEFIAFVHGKASLLWGIFLFSPLLLAMKMKLYPNWKVKQRVFSWFFKGMMYTVFSAKGREFAEKIKGMCNEKGQKMLQEWQEQGADIYVISASIDEWVRPYSESRNIKEVLATKIEVDKNGCLTGRFSSKNCYGQEKVNRLLKVEPERNNYYLFACGDSRGDQDLLQFADEACLLQSYQKLQELFRFCIVGGICTLVDFAIFYLMCHITTYHISLICGYLLSLILNYYLSIYWTFRKPNNLKNAVGIITAHLFNLFIVRMGLIYCFVDLIGLSTFVGSIPAYAISVVANYFVIRTILTLNQRATKHAFCKNTP